MSNTLQAVTPARPDQRDSEAPVMPAHALMSPTLPPTGYLKVGSVVPWSAPVLQWDEDGRPAELVSQEQADWAKAEVDAMDVSWSPTPWPGPRSTGCGHRWAAEVAGQYICTLPKGHGDDIRHEAQGVKGAVLASPTEKVATEALKPARKRPAARKVA